MAMQWCRGRLTDRKVWAEGLFTLSVDVPGVAPFEPGQFLQVGLEFYIVEVESGELSPHLAALAPGAELLVSQRAAGSFTLSKTPDAPHLWLVATGTGLAPYIAMLRTDAPWLRFRKIIVVHGVRHAADLSYQDEFVGHAGNHTPQFVYLPATTREPNPLGLMGRIPALLENGALESRAGCEIRPDNSAVMLCGNPAMLDDMEAALGRRGLRKHRAKSPGHIVVERYW